VCAVQRIHHTAACVCCCRRALLTPPPTPHPIQPRSASVLRSVDKRLGGLAKSLVRDLCNYKAQAIAKLTGCVHRTCSLDIHNFVFLIHRFHSISFTRAQGIRKYKIGFGKEKDGRVGEGLVEGGGKFCRVQPALSERFCRSCLVFREPPETTYHVIDRVPVIWSVDCVGCRFAIPEEAPLADLESEAAAEAAAKAGAAAGTTAGA
jgi:hypothetical protein